MHHGPVHRVQERRGNQTYRIIYFQCRCSSELLPFVEEFAFNFYDILTTYTMDFLATQYNDIKLIIYIMCAGDSSREEVPNGAEERVPGCPGPAVQGRAKAGKHQIMFIFETKLER